MTRKDYVKIALVLAEQKPQHPDPDFGLDVITWRRIVANMGYMLKQDNPRFDFERFYEAAGLEPVCNKG
jgi:hypothetical protein